MTRRIDVEHDDNTKASAARDPRSAGTATALPPPPEATHISHLAPHNDAHQHQSQRSPRSASTATAILPPPSGSPTSQLATLTKSEISDGAHAKAPRPHKDAPRTAPQ